VQKGHIERSSLFRRGVVGDDDGKTFYRTGTGRRMSFDHPELPPEAFAAGGAALAPGAPGRDEAIHCGEVDKPCYTRTSQQFKDKLVGF
jgi:hypothetical protein